MQLRLDLQTHTHYSRPCGWMAPEQLVEAASDTLDGIAVTDHNTMAGVEEVVAAAPNDLLVIPGEEIDTPTGQVIGLFLDAEIAPGQPAEDVIDGIHDQGGVAFAPHPFDGFRDGLTDIEIHAERLDGIEVLNSRCVRSTFDERAASFASDHRLATFGGSDAHFANEVGNAYTLVDIDAKPSSRGTSRLEAVSTALRSGATRPGGHRGSVLNHLGTKVVKLYRDRG